MAPYASSIAISVTRAVAAVSSVSMIFGSPLGLCIYDAKQSLVALNVEKLCLREINEVDVFNFKQYDIFVDNMKFPLAFHFFMADNILAVTI